MIGDADHGRMQTDELADGAEGVWESWCTPRDIVSICTPRQNLWQWRSGRREESQPLWAHDAGMSLRGRLVSDVETNNDEQRCKQVLLSNCLCV